MKKLFIILLVLVPVVMFSQQPTFVEYEGFYGHYRALVGDIESQVNAVKITFINEMRADLQVLQSAHGMLPAEKRDNPALCYGESEIDLLEDFVRDCMQDWGILEADLG